jgi:hypothetical protein
MTMKHALLVILTTVTLGGCATQEFTLGTTTSPHYIASGHVGTAKAWVYAQRTVFEGRAGLEYKFSTPAGEPIKAEKIGAYYSLPSLERDFIAIESVHTMRFVLAPATWTFAGTGATHESPQQ